MVLQTFSLKIVSRIDLEFLQDLITSLGKPIECWLVHW